jgi:hypothetical protein
MTRLADGIVDGHVLENIGASRAFLCPALLEAQEYRDLSHDLVKLLELITDAPNHLFGGDISATCEAVGLSSFTKDIILQTPSRREAPMGRADLMRVVDGFKLLEFNVHSRMGGLENASLAREILKVPLFREFIEKRGLDFVDTLEGISQMLWRIARERGVKRPVVAVMDSPTETVFFVSRRVCSFFNARGFDAFTCHVGEARMSGGALVVDGKRVDIIYRMFLTSNIEANPAEIAVIVDAIRIDAVVMVMGFMADLAGNKGTLALLSDPVNHGHLNEAERALIARYVPWTRLVRPCRTQWQGKDLDLLELALSGQCGFVLKPTSGRGGEGVTAGWTTEPRVWRATVERAINGPVTHILQERVLPVPERMAWPTPAGIKLEEVVLNWGIFVTDGYYNGGIVVGDRPDNNPVFNAGRGAALGCCFHQLPTTG